MKRVSLSAAKAQSDYETAVAEAIIDRDPVAMKKLTGEDWEPPPLERERENSVIGDAADYTERRATHDAAQDEWLEQRLATSHEKWFGSAAGS